LVLTKAEADALDARISRVEARTGVQVVAAVVPRCDSYPEVVWKAFALGAALAALVVVLLDLARPDWMSVYAALSHVLPIIGIGAASALLAVAVPAYARLFVNRFRVDGEVRQHAQAMFLTRQLFRTRARNGVLLLASLFEHKVEVLADIGFDGRIGEPEWHTVVEAMTPLLATHRPGDALGHGLDALEKLLVAKGFRAVAASDDELSNRPIEDRGG
jgi:putative membrane protein